MCVRMRAFIRVRGFVCMGCVRVRDRVRVCVCKDLKYKKKQIAFWNIFQESNSLIIALKICSHASTLLVIYPSEKVVSAGLKW